MSKENARGMQDDTISRQAAIDIIEDFPHGDVWNVESMEEMVDRIKQLPSLQSEIICCEYCKHFVREDREEYTPYGFYNTYFNAFCDKHFDVDLGEFIDVKLDDFCSFAERREANNESN